MNTDAIAKRMAWIACCALTAVVCAMPTKQQLVQAQQLVNDLTADDLRALKAKEKTPGDVAAAHLALADKADTEAGKYLLLQGAFRLYARSGDYDAAAATLQRMRGEIAGLPPEVIVEIVNNEMRRVAASKAPKVLAIFRDAQRMIKYRKQLAAAELDAKAHPENPVFARRVAECHACLGGWPKALPIFAKLGDTAAKWELDPASAAGYDSLKAADFWWNYKATDPEPFKAHAASLYRTALDVNLVSGLKREVVTKRIAEIEASGVPIKASATDEPASAPAVAAAPSAAKAPVTGAWTIPANFKAPLVRTLKLADGVDMDFCAVPAGSFKMSYPDGSPKDNQGKTHKVTITRPFWFSKTFLTLKQYGTTLKTEHHPQLDAECADHEAKFPDLYPAMILGSGRRDECIEQLNQRFGHLLPKGYVFRLPTEAEWEYAYTEGGKKLITKVELYSEEKAIPISRKGLVRHLFPRVPVNQLGIIGGPSEILQPVLDRIDGREGVADYKFAWKHYDYDDYEIDPLRLGSMRRILRYRTLKRSLVRDVGGCIRIVIGPDLVAEKKARKK